MENLSAGSTCGGDLIVTKRDVPMLFRIYGGRLQYSMDNGITWTQA